MPHLRRAQAGDAPAGVRALDRVRCPVLLSWPAKDRVLPFKRYGRAYCEALPSAEVRTLHGVGHVPMLDDPAGIAALIRDFATRAANRCPSEITIRSGDAQTR